MREHHEQVSLDIQRKIGYWMIMPAGHVAGVPQASGMIFPAPGSS
jgi:hypothetical protein